MPARRTSPTPPQQPLREQNRSVIDLIGRSGTDTVRWSRDELRTIGVPERVLQYLPATDPVSHPGIPALQAHGRFIGRYFKQQGDIGQKAPTPDTVQSHNLIIR